MSRRVEPLPGAVFEYVAGVLPEGEALAGVGPSASALEAATAVDTAIRSAREKETPLSDGQVAGLGVLWGKAVSQATGWTWAQIVDGETEYVCLVAQDHAHACVPLAFIRGQVDAAGDRPPAPTALELFEQIVGGGLPKADLGALVFIG